LLSALRGTPLEVLVLPGPTYVGEDLFAGLAEAFPALSPLTLVFRQNIRHVLYKLSRWPGTTYQYASYLAAFSNPDVFAWSYDLEVQPLYSTFPSNLPIDEDQCSRSVSVNDADDSMWTRIPFCGNKIGVTLWHGDWKCLARLFMAHAPTLESLFF
ncbi:hypothetical protein FOMPIDRAFT_1100545, partial [Fomitopsis schrenkii]